MRKDRQTNVSGRTCLVCRVWDVWASECLCRHCWFELRAARSALTVHICDWDHFPEADLTNWNWHRELNCLVKGRERTPGNPLRLLDYYD